MAVIFTLSVSVNVVTSRTLTVITTVIVILNWSYHWPSLPPPEAAGSTPPWVASAMELMETNGLKSKFDTKGSVGMG